MGRGRSSGEGREWGGVDREIRRGQWGGGGGAVERGRWGGGNRKGETGKGVGRRRGKTRGDFTDGYDEMPGWTYGMPGWNEVTVFSDFVYPCNAGYPS